MSLARLFRLMVACFRAMNVSCKMNLSSPLLCLIIAVLFFSPSALRAEDSSLLPALTTIHSIQAEFTQEKRLAILARPIISKGIFLFQAPSSLRWEYMEPIHSLLLMNDGKIRKFSQRNGKLQEERGRGVDSMQMVLTEISDWLDGNISDNSAFAVKEQTESTIILQPKEKGIAALISSIELKLGEDDGLMSSVTIHEGQDSSTRLQFSNQRLNQEIAGARFQQK